MQRGKHVLAVLGWVFTLLIGTGAIFQNRQLELLRKNHDLDLAVKTTELRTRENEQFAELLKLTDGYLTLFREYNKTQRPETREKMLMLRERVSMSKDNLEALESKLAQLENREPRKYRLDFYVPAPPMNLSVEAR